MSRFQYNTNSTVRKNKLKDKKITLHRVKSDIERGRQYFPLHDGKIWAYYRQLSGTEIYLGAGDRRTESLLFVINYNENYLEIDAVEFRGTFYNVTRVDDFEGYKKDLTLYADEIPAQPTTEDVRVWEN